MGLGWVGFGLGWVGVGLGLGWVWAGLGWYDVFFYALVPIPFRSQPDPTQLLCAVMCAVP